MRIYTKKLLIEGAKSAEASTETPAELRVTRGVVQEDVEVPGPSTQSDTSLKDQKDTTHSTSWTKDIP